mmetsp:Transcript_48473/g.114450  ORF Transcript_48473/g.114450 Transcript_48473/m.114450 type:complete len:219 (+) Transcript_48473:727-1383(+)
MGHLTTLEADRRLDFVALEEELLRRPLPHLVVVYVDLVGELDLLELCVLGVLLLQLLLLLRLIPELVVVDDLAHRRVRVRAHHHKVLPTVLSSRQSLLPRHHAEHVIFAVRVRHDNAEHWLDNGVVPWRTLDPCDPRRASTTSPSATSSSTPSTAVLCHKRLQGVARRRGRSQRKLGGARALGERGAELRGERGELEGRERRMEATEIARERGEGGGV